MRMYLKERITGLQNLDDEALKKVIQEPLSALENMLRNAEWNQWQPAENAHVFMENYLSEKCIQSHTPAYDSENDFSFS